MPESSGPTTASSSSSQQRFRIPAWGLVALGTIGFGLCLTLILLVLAYFSRGNDEDLAGRKRSILGQQTMPDGTLLVLEQVTTGSTHEFHYPLPNPPTLLDWLNGDPASVISQRESTPEDVLMVWLTRWDPATHAPLDFDWWLSSTAIFDGGWEVEDEQGARIAFKSPGGTGSAEVHGPRPFRAAPPGSHRLIVAHSTLPLFRHRSKTFQFRVRDRQGDVVAEFDVPHPNSGPADEWIPEPLPISKTAGDLEVSLTSFSGKAHKIRLTNEVAGYKLPPEIRLSPKIRVTKAGQPAPEWKPVRFQLSDALGNVGNLNDCRLNPRERAWRLQMELFRRDNAIFSEEETTSLEPVEIPSEGVAKSLGKRVSAQGATIELLSAGKGNVTYNMPATTPETGTTTHSRDLKKETVKIETRRDGRRLITRVETRLPHLVFKVEQLPPEHRWALQAVDDQRRSVPVLLFENKELWYAFLLVAADAKAVTPSVIIHRGHTVEFLVAPPREEMSKAE